MGSFALSSDKTELFAMAIGAYLDIVCETFNGKAIPALIDINGDHFAGITDYPVMTHGDIEDVDVTAVASYIKDMVGIGVLVPGEGLEDYIPARVGDTRMEDETRRQLRTRNAPETALTSTW